MNIKNRYTCLEQCGNEVYKKGNRCNQCAKKGNKNPSYVSGIYLQSHHCIDCNREIVNVYSTRCKKCAALNRTKKTKKINLCPSCGLHIDRRSTFCKSCSNKDPNKIEKANVKICDRWGTKNPNYKHGKTLFSAVIRGLAEYVNWRNLVFRRDNYTCNICSRKGIELECHHKKPFRNIFKQFLLEHNVTTDENVLVGFAKAYTLFWDVENGETLCKQCHREIENLRMQK